MRIPKRVRFITYSLTIFLISSWFYIFDFGTFQSLFFVLIISLLVGSYFFIFKNYGKANEVYKYFLYWALLNMCLVYMPNYFLQINLFAKILYLVLACSVIYLNALALNVYIVAISKNQPIPLLQTSKLVVSTSIVLVSIIASVIILKSSFVFDNPFYNFLIQGIYFSFFYFGLMSNTEWFYLSEKIGETISEKFMSDFKAIKTFMAIMLIVASLLLSFFQIEDLAKGIIIGTLYYIFIDLKNHYLNRSINGKFVIESTIIFVAVCILVNYF
jgi:hypothetical protein